ncbi:MAG: hypothetical protein IPP13_03190 [Kouleothrix sp.]|nr:hypothetical protein [Kouleothrix sp.]
MNNRAHDIEAEITFLTTEQGGRKTPAFSGYRPQFYYDGHDWDAVHDYGDIAQVAPGQTVTAFLSFLSPEYHIDRLYPGKEFQLREGQRVIGCGRVTKILDLPESAQRANEERPRRYYKGYWPEDRGDEFAAWGGATYYFECNASGYPDQQIEIYDNGITLWFDISHHTDAYGMLSDKPIEPFDEDLQQISREEFYRLLTTIKPYNRLIKPDTNE